MVAFDGRMLLCFHDLIILLEALDVHPFNEVLQIVLRRASFGLGPFFRLLRVRDLLLVEHLYDHFDGALLVGELESVREEIEDDLHVSPLVTQDRLDQVQVFDVVNLC